MFFSECRVNEMTKFVGTRGKKCNKPDMVSFADAIISPLSGFGGLYVPNKFENFNINMLAKMLKLSYEDLAYEILLSFRIGISDSDLRDALKAYSSFDTPNNPAPVVILDKHTFVQELWHGPTRSFKDMALQPFPYLISNFAKLHGKKYLVATTTSGDTGPAALAGFKDLPNTKVIVYYPVGGTSNIQSEQMLKAQGDNVKVVGVVNADFDIIQANLKQMLRSVEISDKLHESGYDLSAANSVNFGRIIFQIVYHFWSYFELVRNQQIKLGETVNYIIPSGNFGNALGAFYARIIGLPIKKIILASNENNVLTDFVNKGIYNIRSRAILKTNSPAMDILISSNVESLLHCIFGEKRNLELMLSLHQDNFFRLYTDEKNVVTRIFSAGYATNQEVLAKINSTFCDYNYLIDPHTATGFVVRDKLGICDKSIIVSTAEWTKFPETITEALTALIIFLTNLAFQYPVRYPN